MVNKSRPPERNDSQSLSARSAASMRARHAQLPSHADVVLNKTCEIVLEPSGADGQLEKGGKDGTCKQSAQTWKRGHCRDRGEAPGATENLAHDSRAHGVKRPPPALHRPPCQHMQQGQGDSQPRIITDNKERILVDLDPGATPSEAHDKRREDRARLPPPQRPCCMRRSAPS